MEDYNAAFLRCFKDVEALHGQRRCIAAMHFGGVAIECFLKYILVSSIPQGATMDWYKNVTRTPNHGHVYKNLGHNYGEAWVQHSELQTRVASNPNVQQWLATVEEPDGCHFIDMRYSSQEPQAAKYDEWRDAYERLVEWLQIQSMTL
jgi:hypothetical protein